MSLEELCSSWIKRAPKHFLGVGDIGGIYCSIWCFDFVTCIYLMQDQEGRYWNPYDWSWKDTSTTPHWLIFGAIVIPYAWKISSKSRLAVNIALPGMLLLRRTGWVASWWWLGMWRQRRYAATLGSEVIVAEVRHVTTCSNTSVSHLHKCNQMQLEKKAGRLQNICVRCFP